MKKTLLAFTIICLSHYLGYGQNMDSLTQRIVKLEMDQRNIKMNLTKSHKQYKGGTFLVLGGAIATIAGAATLPSKSDLNQNNNAQIGLMTLGGILTSVGLIIQMDSHKWLGRTGRSRK